MNAPFDSEPVLAAPRCSDSDWKDGIHKENGETCYYTPNRRFVLRTIQDKIGWVPVWVFESMRPGPKPQ
jgi:hypothetical protein